jgi:pimeloyl-ACP methyl ester carboxylesterase
VRLGTSFAIFLPPGLETEVLMLFSLMLALAGDSAVIRHVVVAPAETLRAVIVGQGRPLVVIPGLLGSAYSYRKVIPPLNAAGLQVIVIEPIGVGFSSRPSKSDYSLTAQSQRVAAVLDSLGGIACAPVLAHSAGASIALRLAAHRPDLICGVVAENGGGMDTVATTSVRRAASYAWLIKIFGGRGKVRSQLRKGMLETAGDSSWVTPEVIEGYTAGAAGDLGAVLRAIKGMARAKEPELMAELLPNVKVPVHLLIGGAPRGSGVTLTQFQVLKAGLPQLVVDTVPRAGLRIHEEQPGVVVKAVLEMLEQLSTHRATPSAPARSPPR